MDSGVACRELTNTCILNGLVSSLHTTPEEAILFKGWIKIISYVAFDLRNAFGLK